MGKKSDIIVEFTDIAFGNPGAVNIAYYFAYQDRTGKCLSDQTPAIFMRNAISELGPDANWVDSDLRNHALVRTLHRHLKGSVTDD